MSTLHPVSPYSVLLGLFVLGCHGLPEATELERSSKVPHVVEVSPTRDTMPINVLRFSVTFDTPMRSGFAYRKVRLVDANGRALDNVFLDPVHELWSKDRRRLTLLMDPGRLKTGVGPRRRLGRPFAVGDRVRLVVDAGWPNIYGASTVRALSKTYEIGPIDEGAATVEEWGLRAPATAESPLDVLVVDEFARSAVMDYVRVIDARGDVVAGETTYDPRLGRWRFQPKRGWRDETYRLVVYEGLEDLAGNNLATPFETVPGVRRELGLQSRSFRLRDRAMQKSG